MSKEPTDIVRPFRRLVMLDIEAVSRKRMRESLVKSTKHIQGSGLRVLRWSILTPRKG